MNAGSIMEVYTVFTPNSFPHNKKPITSNTTFKINVISDTVSGITFDKTIAKPEILLTAAWLGIKKKKTAAAMMATAAVKMMISFTNSRFFKVLVPSYVFIPSQIVLFPQANH